MKTFIYLAIGSLTLAGGAYADHDKSCNKVHGKVTVVTEEGISVGDKMYMVGKSTRITKGEKSAKLNQISSGDIVCVDVRGKDDIGGGEVAAVAILIPSDPVPTQEKVYVREKEIVRLPAHDKNCNHVHGKVTRIQESTLMVDEKPYAFRQTTKFVKGDQTTTIETIKTGDVVCLDAGDADSLDRHLTSVLVLSPSDAAPFESREVIREREKIKEKIREEK